MRGRTSYQTLTPAKIPFNITDNERMILETFLMGNSELRVSNYKQSLYFNREISNLSDDIIEFYQLTMIISIVTITLIYLIITPMLSMILDR